MASVDPFQAFAELFYDGGGHVFVSQIRVRVSQGFGQVAQPATEYFSLFTVKEMRSFLAPFDTHSGPCKEFFKPFKEPGSTSPYW